MYIFDGGDPIFSDHERELFVTLKGACAQDFYGWVTLHVRERNQEPRSYCIEERYYASGEHFLASYTNLKKALSEILSRVSQEKE